MLQGPLPLVAPAHKRGDARAPLAALKQCKLPRPSAKNIHQIPYSQVVLSFLPFRKPPLRAPMSLRVCLSTQASGGSRSARLARVSRDSSLSLSLYSKFVSRRRRHRVFTGRIHIFRSRGGPAANVSVGRVCGVSRRGSVGVISDFPGTAQGSAARASRLGRLVAALLHRPHTGGV